MTNYQEYWDNKHDVEYKNAMWVTEPNYFAKDASTYFLPKGYILELGCGQGQDSGYFLSQGYHVTAADLSYSALEEVDKKFATNDAFTSSFIDLGEGKLPFGDQSFDVVYAHLSLHYFSIKNTKRLFQEIYRVLKPDAMFAFLVNSIHDPECGRGEQIEDDYFHTPAGIDKRFFSPETIRPLIDEKFEVVVLDEKGQTEKDKLEGEYGLVRFIGKKL